jgi:perosamine synthetase
VIVPAITFAASANAAVYEGATPVFVDVLPDTLLIDPEDVERKLTSRTKAIVSVDYAGQPADYDVLVPLAAKADVRLVADGCHALGARLGDRFVGSLADLTTFSFHPVKHITTGEGGMVVTDDQDLANVVRRFRNHGIATEFRERAERGTWSYDMVELGYNYRISDLQCALGLSQLKKLPRWVARRQEIAHAYDEAFARLSGVTPLAKPSHVQHAYHLYVVRLSTAVADRQAVFSAMREAQIGVNVHYLPVYLHSFYRKRFGTGPGLCPVAERAYEEIMSLPMFPAMTDGDVARVVEVLSQAVGDGA